MDLFSFLEDAPMEDIEQEAPIVPKKRKADKAESIPPPIKEDSEPGPSVQKKQRLASPNPVVVDEFETEAKREVAASAGLTGGVEAGSRLELKHQVCIALLILWNILT